MIRTILVWLLLIIPAGAADLFQWTSPASHHAAAVRVRAGDSAGSGVYVALSDDIHLVLTCAHVVRHSGKASVTWSDGTTTTGEVVTDRTGADSAIVKVLNSSVKPLLIAPSPPQIGETVEYIGFGGPAGNRIRPHLGQVLGYRQQDMRSSAPVVSGDSGGAILNTSQQVVGLSAYGENTVAVVSGWNVYRPSGGPGQPSLKAFGERVVTLVQCGPSAPPRGGSGLYPPQTPYQKPPEALPIVPVPPIAPKPVDLDELADILAEKLATDERFRGPPGDDGKDGQDGPAGRDGAVGPPGTTGPAGPPVSDEQIRAAVIAWAQSHPEELAGLVLPHLPPLHFRQVYGPTGELLATPDRIRLGEGFTFYLWPEGWGGQKQQGAKNE